MKIKPIFQVNSKLGPQPLTEAATYANELYRSGFKMLVALREASKLYGVEIHTIAMELGSHGGKSKRKGVRN